LKSIQVGKLVFFIAASFRFDVMMLFTFNDQSEGLIGMGGESGRKKDTSLEFETSTFLHYLFRIQMRGAYE